VRGQEEEAGRGEESRRREEEEVGSGEGNGQLCHDLSTQY
jgi:hypothetical protein